MVIADLVPRRLLLGGRLPKRIEELRGPVKGVILLPRNLSWPGVRECDVSDDRRRRSLYGMLLALRPSPIVELNRAIALGELQGPEQGLQALHGLCGKLAAYPFLPAAAGRLHLRAGRREEAAASFREAVRLARNPAEAQLFQARLGACS